MSWRQRGQAGAARQAGKDWQPEEGSTRSHTMMRMRTRDLSWRLERRRLAPFATSVPVPRSLVHCGRPNGSGTRCAAIILVAPISSTFSSALSLRSGPLPLKLFHFLPAHTRTHKHIETSRSFCQRRQRPATRGARIWRQVPSGAGTCLSRLLRSALMRAPPTRFIISSYHCRPAPCWIVLKSVRNTRAQFDQAGGPLLAPPATLFGSASLCRLFI